LIGLRPGMSRRSSEKVAHFVAREVAGNSTSASAGFVIASVGPEVHLARSRSGQSPAVADRIRSADACHKRTFDTTTRPCLGWNGESDGRKTAQHHNDQRFFHEFLRVRSHVTVEVAIGSDLPRGFILRCYAFEPWARLAAPRPETAKPQNKPSNPSKDNHGEREVEPWKRRLLVSRGAFDVRHIGHN